jgi:hypothetical protein
LGSLGNEAIKRRITEIQNHNPRVGFKSLSATNYHNKKQRVIIARQDRWASHHIRQALSRVSLTLILGVLGAVIQKGNKSIFKAIANKGPGFESDIGNAEAMRLFFAQIWS